jgi:hypothetical protein
MNYILALNLGIWKRAGHHIHAAVDVREICVAVLLALTSQCISQSLWCGENRRVILTNCYCYLTKRFGHNSKTKHAIVYPNIPLALRPFEHDDSLSVPKLQQLWTLSEEEPTSSSPEDDLDLHVPVWILISRNELYLILYRSLNLMIE